MDPVTAAILRAVLKETLKQIVKKTISKQAAKTLGKKAATSMLKKTTYFIEKKLIQKSGLAQPLRLTRDIKKFFSTSDKIGFIQEKVAKSNPLLNSAYRTFIRTRKEEWRKLANIINKQRLDYERYMVHLFKTKQGLSKRDFVEFRDFMESRMNEREKRQFGNLFREEINCIFQSSWIFFGLFIPYGKNGNRGILALQLKIGSKRNPSGFYQWVNVPKVVWLEIMKEPTGKMFWEKWYHKNRTNKRYLTADSIYYYEYKNGKKVYINQR